MSGRTFAIGDIHGEPEHLKALLARLPELESTDTVVFLGDYLDRGPNSRDVVEFVRNFPEPDEGQGRRACAAITRTPGFASARRAGTSSCCPLGNGCLAAMRSYTGGPVPEGGRGAREPTS